MQTMTGKVYSDGTTTLYNSMKGYVNYMRDIVNSPGFFVNNFKQAQKQINEINSMRDMNKQKALISIKKDLLAQMDKITNWDKLRDNLKDFITTYKKKKPTFTEVKFQTFKFKYVDPWDALTDDYINNMYTDIADIDSEDVNNTEYRKNIKSYNNNKALFNNDLDTFLCNIQEWENNLTECRNKNYPALTNNIQALYNIHTRYVYEKLHKLPSSFMKNIDGKEIECVEYKTNKKTIAIPLCDSQKTFIKKGIELMLDITSS